MTAGEVTRPPSRLAKDLVSSSLLSELRVDYEVIIADLPAVLQSASGAVLAQAFVDNAVLVVRAQLYSIALFPLLVLLLRSEAARPSRRIWLAVPMVALWANLHGGVLVGFCILAAYLVLKRHRRIEAACVLAASAAALLATPALLHTVGYYAAVLFLMGLVMPGVDNYAHAGGFLGGYATSAFFNPLTRERGDHLLIAMACLAATLLAIAFSVLHGLGIL